MKELTVQLTKIIVPMVVFAYIMFTPLPFGFDPGCELFLLMLGSLALTLYMVYTTIRYPCRAEILSHKFNDWQWGEDKSETACHWHKCRRCGLREQSGAHHYELPQIDSLFPCKLQMVRCTSCGDMVEVGGHSFVDERCSVCGWMNMPLQIWMTMMTTAMAIATDIEFI